MASGNNKNSLQKGYLLHWYEIKSIIGSGSFGITYLAHDNNLDRDVAIKEFMPEDFATRESDTTVHPKAGNQKSLYEWGLKSFTKEAQTLAKFYHPNIVRVLSVFEENNTAYMIMEYAQGDDLSTVYKKSPQFTEERFLDTFIPIMDGLALVHNAGFIHRDIKPANIYICDNNSPLLLDFGSARQSTIGGKTRELTSLVTYGYAPFEQYNEGSGKQGPWTDIYSLGACIHVGITGQKPVDALYRGGNFLETGKDAYLPLSIVAKGQYSENFLLAVDNALMFKINDRPQNIMDWADMLLGKTRAPELPEHMFQPPNDEETIIQPVTKIKSRSTTGPSQRTQGLVDNHGKRNAEIAESKAINERRRASDKIEHVDSPRDSSNNISGKDLKSSILAKLWLPIAFGSSAVILLLVSSNMFISGSLTPEATESAQEIQQQDQLLEQLLNNAKKALSQKEYVMPTDNNAYYFYQQVLKIKPDNKAATEGIKKIESQLLLLARAKYDNGDMSAAQQYLQQLNIINPLSEEAQNQIKNITQLNNFLNKADETRKKSKYTKPEKNNAFYYYQQALVLEPDNQAAKKGIKYIETQLYKQANTAYKKKQYKKSLDYLAQVKFINPESKNAKLLENTIKQEQSRESQIASLLNKATTQKNNNYYTSPKNNNAFNTYNKILKLEPGNQQALDGLKNIQWHYKSQFKQHIAASKLSKAENDIRIMKKISAPSSLITQMQETLNNSQQKIEEANKVKKVAAKTIDIHLVSNKIGQFKMAIQLHNKNKLKDLSQYSPGREQFVSQLLSQYKKINVKISNLQLISKENQAKAQVELTDLVDINDKRITPGSWSKFDIIVRHNNKKQLKVHW